MRFRFNDSPEIVSQVIQKRDPEGRRRTVVYSALVAGIVSMSFGYLNDRDQVKRSRQNCNYIQDDRRLQAAQLNKQADDIFGNKNRKPPVPPFKFEGTAFEEFEALILGNAAQARQEAKEISARIEDCEEVYPHPDFNPFN